MRVSRIVCVPMHRCAASVQPGGPARRAAQRHRGTGPDSGGTWPGSKYERESCKTLPTKGPLSGACACPMSGRISDTRPTTGRSNFEPRGIRPSHSGKHLAAPERMYLQQRFIVDRFFPIPPLREHARLQSNQARSCAAPRAPQAPRLVFDPREV